MISRIPHLRLAVLAAVLGARRDRHPHDAACPIVDADRCVGIVTRSDLLAAPDDVAGSVGTTFGGAVVTDTALTALHVMLEEQVDHLPVLDGDRLIGICTRTDILRARHRVTAAEEPEPGWLARLRAGEG